MQISAKPTFFKISLAFYIFLFMNISLSAKDYRQKIYLWEGIPKMETQKRDTILYYVPPVSTPLNGQSLSETEGKIAAVIICPGGSYHHLGMPHEGFASARWFSSHGFAAFLLR